MPKMQRTVQDSSIFIRDELSSKDHTIHEETSDQNPIVIKSVETLHQLGDTTSNEKQSISIDKSSSINKSCSIKQENRTYRTREVLLNLRPVKMPGSASPKQVSTERTHSIHYSDGTPSDQGSPNIESPHIQAQDITTLRRSGVLNKDSQVSGFVKSSQALPSLKNYISLGVEAESSWKGKQGEDNAVEKLQNKKQNNRYNNPTTFIL